MNIVVPVKLVPDLVEELEIDDDGTDLDRDFLSLKINEFCDHALEEALQLKDAHGGQVTAIALEAEEADKVLFTALAKGASGVTKFFITAPLTMVGSCPASDRIQPIIPVVVDLPLVPPTAMLRAAPLNRSAKSSARVIRVAPTLNAAATSGTVSSTAADATRI